MVTPSDVHDASEGSGPVLSLRLLRWSRRLVLAYVAAGLLWICVGAWLLGEFQVPPQHAVHFELGKGVTFVLLTSALLWWVCVRMRQSVVRAYGAAVESAEAYRMLFENSPTGAFILDVGSRHILAINDAALATFGWHRSEVVGAPLDTIGLFADPNELAAWEHDVFVHALPVHSSLQTCQHRLGRSLRLVLRCHALQYRGRPAQLVVTEDRGSELVALAEAEEARALLEGAERLAGVGSWRRHGRSSVGMWSRNAWSLFGRSPPPGNAAPTVDAFMQWIHPADQPGFAAAIDGLIERGEPVDMRFRTIHEDGTEVVLHGRGVRRGGFIEGTLQDVTAQIAADRTLAEHLALFRSLVGMLPVGVLILQEERVVFANETACRQLGHADPEAMQRTHLADLFLARELASVRDRILDLGERPQFKTRQLRCADGGTFVAEVAKVRVTFRGAPAIQLVVRDLSEQMHLWAELSEQHAKLRQLSRRLLRVQEDERRMLARELHDDIGQSLTSISLQAGLAAKATDDSLRRASLEELTLQCQHTIERLRDLSSLLRPPQLDRLGIAAALRGAAEKLFEKDGPALDLQLDELPQRPPPEVELACFRIAQECLTNVLRHSGAQRVRVQLHAEDGALHLEVVDDGSGFNPTAGPESASGSGLGLVGMRERVEALGGRLHIDSGADAGTRVRARLPFDAQPQDPAG